MLCQKQQTPITPNNTFMKRFIVVSILFLNLVFVFGQKNSLKEYADKEGITTVVLSKNMLSFFPKDANLTYGGVNVAEFIDKLSGINIFVSPTGETATKLVKYATEFMKTPGYDMLMGIKTEKGEDAKFYVRGTEKNITELVLIVQGKSKESAVMQFMGNFTMEDIQEMVKNAAK